MRVLTENKEVKDLVDRLLDAGHIKLSEALLLLEKEVYHEPVRTTGFYQPYRSYFGQGSGGVYIPSTTITYTSSSGRTYSSDDYKPDETL